MELPDHIRATADMSTAFASRATARDVAAMLGAGWKVRSRPAGFVVERTDKPRRIEAYGVRGMDNKPWRRVFASSAAFQRWCASEAGQNATVHGHRDAARA